jgi:hypothetical protein
MRQQILYPPLAMVALGGVWNVAYLVRARLAGMLGYLPECQQTLCIDFASDPPRPPADLFPEIPSADWEAAALAASEQALVGLGPDIPELVKRIRADDEEVAWIADIVPIQLLERYSGGEASQIPALTRAALAFCAEDPGRGDPNQTSSWYELLYAKLQAIAPGGAALHDLALRRGIAPDNAGAPPTLALVAGCGGGTGNGSLLMVAACARAIAAEIGLRLRIHAFLVSGLYRPADGMEPRKLALEYTLDQDLEYAMDPARQPLRVVLGRDRQITASGPLFDDITRFDAGSRLKHDYAAMAALAAEAVLFRYFSAAGQALLRSGANAPMIPALRRLGKERSWLDSKGEEEIVA